MSLQTFNDQYDYVTESCSFTSKGKPILLLLRKNEYLGFNLNNITKWSATATSTTAYRYFYQNIPSMGNSAIYQEKIISGSVGSQTQTQTAGVDQGMIILPDAPPQVVDVSSISRATPAVVNFTGEAPPANAYLRVDSVSGMPQAQGGIFKVGTITGQTFTISLNSAVTGITAATIAKMVVTPLIHTWKIISVSRNVNAALVLSNVDGIRVGSILTLSTMGSELSEVTNQRVIVSRVATDSWTVITDLDTSRLLSSDSVLLSSSEGIVPSVVGLNSLEPNPNIVEAGPLQSYPVLNPGADKPAGEFGDRIRLDLLINGVR